MPSSSNITTTTAPLFDVHPPRKRPSSLAELRAFQKQRSLPSSQESRSSQSSFSSSSPSPIKKFKSNHTNSHPVSAVASLPFFFQKSATSSKNVPSTATTTSTTSSTSSVSTSPSPSSTPTPVPFFTATETKSNPFLLDSSTYSFPSNPFDVLIQKDLEPTLTTHNTTSTNLHSLDLPQSSFSSTTFTLHSPTTINEELEIEKEKEKKTRIHEHHPQIILQGAILPIHTSEALYRLDKDSLDDVLPPPISSSSLSSSRFHSTSMVHDESTPRSTLGVVHQDPHGNPHPSIPSSSLSLETESSSLSFFQTPMEENEEFLEEEEEVDPWSEATFSKTDIKLAHLILPPSTSPPLFSSSSSSSYSSSFASSSLSNHSTNNLTKPTPKVMESSVYHQEDKDSDNEMEETTLLLHHPHPRLASSHVSNALSRSNDLKHPIHFHGLDSKNKNGSSTETQMEVDEQENTTSSVHAMVDAFPSSSSFSSSTTTTMTTTDGGTSVTKKSIQRQGVSFFYQFQHDSKSLLHRLVFYNDLASWSDTFLSPSLHVSCDTYFASSFPSFHSPSPSSSSFVTDLDACLFHFSLTHPLSKSHWETALDHLFSLTSMSSSFYYLHSHVGVYVTSSHILICTAWKAWVHQCTQYLGLKFSFFNTSSWITARLDRSKEVDSLLIPFLKQFDQWKPPSASSSSTTTTATMNAQAKKKKDTGQDPSGSYPNLISDTPFLYGVLDKAKVTRCGPIQQLQGLTYCLQIDGYVMPSSIPKLQSTLKTYLPSDQFNQLKIQFDYEPLAQFFDTPLSSSSSSLLS